jgi:hypothetical protein
MVGGRIYYVDVQVEALLAHFGDHTTEWYHEEVIAQYDGRDSPGIVFARKDSIVKLKTYGYLCMMDSTHDTYTLGWPLYTIHCRDSYGSTTPRAFFLLRHWRTPKERHNLTKLQFRTTALGEMLPDFGFERLPGPIQAKILDEVRLGTEENHPNLIPTFVRIPGITKNDVVPAGEDSVDIADGVAAGEANVDITDQELEASPLLAGLPSCTCHWYLKWQLPCQHIWLHHALFGSLTPGHFTQLIELWVHNGYEIYSELQGYFDEAMDGVIGMPSRAKVDIKYASERVTSKAWCLVRDLEGLGASGANGGWVIGLHGVCE